MKILFFVFCIEGLYFQEKLYLKNFNEDTDFPPVVHTAHQ